MSTDVIKPDSWRNLRKQTVDLWIGGFSKEAQESVDEVQMFPVEGCRIPVSREFPGLIEETLRYSWCYIAYPLQKWEQLDDGVVAGYHVVYRDDIDESYRAQQMRRNRDQ